MTQATHGLLWTEDVMVDQLDHYLSGTAEWYYHKQVNTGGGSSSPSSTK